ncbi:LPS export ABC transporter periplasmic protein LptC [Breznakiella homolactica]|uniref:LPS export ABC transporter periplasmic protein LptC n=1 Tax=Breznakiella homolactica TaxID=2798577 RepID=A0A7T8B9R3_9SPIR|nr:LPS export ABC transporter periplasmic protein LptC [Breznakiella homolactica]QQO09874.1 LPS export ABC transporter periplasmic protein LptC [Breznakiella homolactica]
MKGTWRSRSVWKLALVLLCTAVSCTFDYGTGESQGTDQPDIIMHDVEYVRVRNGEPMVRFEAETAERYEKKQIMELSSFSFEQYNTGSGDVNASGEAGAASVELDSGNVRLQERVLIIVDSEDITIETDRLTWEDSNRVLSGGEDDEVSVYRADGTYMNGRGFSADARRRTWEFTSGIQGTYVHEDEEEESQ